VVLLGPSGSEADLAFSTALLCWAVALFFLFGALADFFIVGRSKRLAKRTFT